MGGSPPIVGQAYVGSFTLQDGSVLATDGKNLHAVLTAFRLQLGDLVWDASHPYPAGEFAGFRGPRPGDPLCPGGTPVFCVGAPSPGFDVAGGQLIGLFGGVFGASDTPFVDFESFTGATDRFQANLSSVSAFGTIQLALVPWPSALLMLSAGLGLTSLISGMLRQRGRHE